MYSAEFLNTFYIKDSQWFFKGELGSSLHLHIFGLSVEAYYVINYSFGHIIVEIKVHL